MSKGAGLIKTLTLRFKKSFISVNILFGKVFKIGHIEIVIPVTQPTKDLQVRDLWLWLGNRKNPSDLIWRWSDIWPRVLSLLFPGGDGDGLVFLLLD